MDNNNSSDTIDSIAQSIFVTLIFCSVVSDSYIMFDNFLKNNYIKKKINYCNKIYQIIIGLSFNNYKKDKKGNIIISNEEKVTDDKVTEETVTYDKVSEEKIIDDKVTEEKVSEEKVTEEKVTEEKVIDNKVTEDIGKDMIQKKNTPKKNIKEVIKKTKKK